MSVPGPVRCDTVNYQQKLLPPSKESLGQGNVFYTCLLFCPMGGICMMSLSVWLPGPIFLLGMSLSLVPCSFQGVSVWGSLSWGGCLCPWGLCPGGVSGGLCPGGLYQGESFPPTNRDDTHPTGMHYCYNILLETRRHSRLISFDFFTLFLRYYSDFIEM